MFDWAGARPRGQMKVQTFLKRGTVFLGDAYTGPGTGNFFRYSLSGDATWVYFCYPVIMSYS